MISNKKIILYLLASICPKLIRNIYLMTKFRCVINPAADIKFLKNISIGKGTMIGKCDIIAQNKVEIGCKCVIQDYAILNSKKGSILIGDETAINHQVLIFGSGGVEIGKRVAIAPGVKIIKNHIIPQSKKDKYGETTDRPTFIGDNVWICANAVIVDGVSVGNYSIIGANSFVNKDIPESVIAAGCPAVVKKRR